MVALLDKRFRFIDLTFTGKRLNSLIQFLHAEIQLTHLIGQEFMRVHRGLDALQFQAGAVGNVRSCARGLEHPGNVLRVEQRMSHHRFVQLDRSESFNVLHGCVVGVHELLGGFRAAFRSIVKCSLGTVHERTEDDRKVSGANRTAPRVRKILIRVRIQERVGYAHARHFPEGATTGFR